MIEAQKQIYAHLLAGLSPEDAARASLAECGEDELRGYVLPIFEIRARHLARGMARHIEDSVMDLHPTDDARDDRVSAVKQIAQTTFSLTDGRRVSWSDATVADHLERARWQRKRADTIHEDARRHEVAAELLRRRRKKCLNQIADWQEVLAAEVSGAEAAA